MSYLFRNGRWTGFQTRVITEGAFCGRSVSHPGVRLRLQGQNEASDGSGFVAQVTLDLDLVALQQLRVELMEAESQLLAVTQAPEAIDQAERELALLPSEVFGYQDPPRNARKEALRGH